MPMKRKISTFLFGLLFLIGFGILIYPTVSNQWNTYRQNQLISSYDNTIQHMESEDFTSEWEKAKAFNDTIQQNNLYGDVFGEDENDIKDTEYWKILNVADDGVMGYLSIPKINIKLAIYHGTGDKDLQTGVGHLNGTKLPIGGESTHSVLAAHRGLPSAKLFTDLDKLKLGDMFFITVCNQKLAYEVDNVAVVEPTDIDLIRIDTQQDYVTLLTCTPYGVNTHRLLVRGHRVDMAEEAISEVEEKAVPEGSTWIEKYAEGLAIGLITSFAAMLLLLLILLIRRRQKKKTGNIAGSERK